MHLADYQRAALQAFGIQISKSSAENYLKASGFRSKVLQTKTDGFSRTGDELAELVWQMGPHHLDRGDLSAPSKERLFY